MIWELQARSPPHWSKQRFLPTVCSFQRTSSGTLQVRRTSRLSGWFNLGAVLDKETDFGAKISFYVDDEQTSIDGLSVGNGYIDGAVYTLGGQLVGKNVNEKLLKRGVYIKDGKKFVVK